MQPDPRTLYEKLGRTPVTLGMYDTPRPEAFDQLITPPPKGHACVYAQFNRFKKGQSLRLTAERAGCPGAAHWLFGREFLPREFFVEFLVGEEGLKCSNELMHRWLDQNKPWTSVHGTLVLGPLRPEQYEYLQTVTFFVDPDELSALTLAAQYHSTPEDPPSVTIPFGPGCAHLLPQFDDLSTPPAIVGATDIAMRPNLPPEILAFTVTKPMFERIANVDEESFWNKRFWNRLRKKRLRAEKVSGS